MAPQQAAAVQESPLRNKKSNGRSLKNSRRPVAQLTKNEQQLPQDLDTKNLMTEVIRLRQKMHKTACDLADAKNKLALSQRELRMAQEAGDELSLKYSNLIRKERRISSELLEEKCKNEELNKQVKAMGQNLVSLSSLVEENGAGSHDKSHSGEKKTDGALGLQKRCFKLVQQNTALTQQNGLLARQKGWAEAKASVIQEELTSVYLGTHKRVKDSRELEDAAQREFNSTPATSSLHDEPEVVKLLQMQNYKHHEVVVDFLTHIVHTRGRDVDGFLQSSRIFSEAMRGECLSALGREFYANWQLNRKVPQVLRSAERVVLLNDLLQAFDSIAREIMTMCGCAHARLWIVDRNRQLLWTCVRAVQSHEGQSSHSAVTVPFPLPARPAADANVRGLSKNSSASNAVVVSADELKSKSLVASAFALQRPVSVTEAHTDPRYLQAVDACDMDGPVQSSLCVPIGGDGGKVHAVLQAMNKHLAPEFDPQEDIKIMRLLGHVSVEVVRVFETSSAASINAKRKETLLALISKHVPLEMPGQLVQLLESVVQDLFVAKAAALHLVCGEGSPADRRYTERLVAERAGRVSRTPSNILAGLVGQVVHTWNNCSVPSSQLDASEYDKEIDLPVQERTVLHTVPICEGSSCRAVFQFLCQERERTMIADDGVYQPDNTAHVRLLQLILNLVQRHFHVLDPRGHSGSKGVSELDSDLSNS
eukprot:TRINITY_DN39567_c0_g1_i1.p1 TRINITY_DN39567_c0_g1~~TRINITY_DN39567_c0_g1_i1.p1  ORF type:complete len:783 (-),score=162.53 TRINITY_DN39567_c0_g1_i1:39-2162(-)